MTGLRTPAQRPRSGRARRRGPTNAAQIELRGICSGEHRTDHDDRDQEPMATEACIGQRLEVRLLGDEAGGERHAGHRGRRDGCRRLNPPPPSPERGQVTDIAGSRLAIEDADDHEQCGLEERVDDEEEPTRECSVRRCRHRTAPS